MGESWSVNVDTIAQAANGNSALLTDYEEQAWLYSQITPSTSQAQETLIQFAVLGVARSVGRRHCFGPVLDGELDRHSEPHESGFDRSRRREPGLLQPVRHLRSRSRSELLHVGEWVSVWRAADLHRRVARAGDQEAWRCWEPDCWAWAELCAANAPRLTRQCQAHRCGTAIYLVSRSGDEDGACAIDFPRMKPSAFDLAFPDSVRCGAVRA